MLDGKRLYCTLYAALSLLYLFIYLLIVAPLSYKSSKALYLFMYFAFIWLPNECLKTIGKVGRFRLLRRLLNRLPSSTTSVASLTQFHKNFKTHQLYPIFLKLRLALQT